MGTATNFVVFDKSFQAASLGDASLIAIVATIQVLLHAVEELLELINSFYENLLRYVDS